MRGFQKGITLGSRTSGSAFEVAGGVGGVGGVGGWCGQFNYSVSPVQSGVGVRSFEFGF